MTSLQGALLQICIVALLAYLQLFMQPSTGVAWRGFNQVGTSPFNPAPDENTCKYLTAGRRTLFFQHLTRSKTSAVCTHFWTSNRLIVLCALTDSTLLTKGGPLPGVHTGLMKTISKSLATKSSQFHLNSEKVHALERNTILPG